MTTFWGNRWLRLCQCSVGAMPDSTKIQVDPNFWRFNTSSVSLLDYMGLIIGMTLFKVCVCVCFCFVFFPKCIRYHVHTLQSRSLPTLCFCMSIKLDGILQDCFLCPVMSQTVATQHSDSMRSRTRFAQVWCGHIFCAWIRKIPTPSCLEGAHTRYQSVGLWRGPRYPLGTRDLVIGKSKAPDQYSWTQGKLVVPSTRSFRQCHGSDLHQASGWHQKSCNLRK